MLWFVTYLLIGALVQCLVFIERVVIRNVLVDVYGYTEKEKYSVSEIVLIMLISFGYCCANILLWPVSIGFEIWLIKQGR
jgi:hypothetical protein